MKRIRIGKDISLRWAITTDGVAIPLEGRDLTVEIRSSISKVSSIPYKVDGNTLIITYYGYEQKCIGEYSLTLWENKGKPGQNVVDAIKAFKLVKTSPEEGDFISGDLQIESVDLGTADLSIGYRAINIDTLRTEASQDSVEIKGETYSNEGFSVEIPKATTDQAGVMSAEDVRTLKEHGENISQINTSLQGHQSAIDSLNTATERHSESISQINSTLHEHTQSINNTSDIVSGHTSEIESIKSEQTEQNNSISQINSTLADHEERLVYTESDLVKVREEYNGIISELIKSIEQTQKSFVVETNDSEGYMTIDNVNKTIPANTIKAFRFNNTFNSSQDKNLGIASFRFLLTYTSEFTVMSYMFRGCSSLTSLDLSSFDTSKVTYMIEMFQGCSSLTSLDLSSFDTSKVTLMISMFRGCSSLTSLDLSSFDTSNAGNMSSMFFGCSSLTSLLLGPNFFKTPSVTSIDFSNCRKWTNDTVITSLVTNSYDRASAGLNTLTIQLHANTKAALTDEQKAAITSKGYTIA